MEATTPVLKLDTVIDYHEEEPTHNNDSNTIDNNSTRNLTETSSPSIVSQERNSIGQVPVCPTSSSMVHIPIINGKIDESIPIASATINSNVNKRKFSEFSKDVKNSKKKKERKNDEDKKEGVTVLSSSEAKQEEPMECSICYEKVEEQGLLDSCKHEFCLECISKWAKTSNACPICKQRYSLITSKNLSSGNNSEEKQGVKINVPTRNFRLIDDEYDDEYDDEFHLYLPLFHQLLTNSFAFDDSDSDDEHPAYHSRNINSDHLFHLFAQNAQRGRTIRFLTRRTIHRGDLPSFYQPPSNNPDDPIVITSDDEDEDNGSTYRQQNITISTNSLDDHSPQQQRYSFLTGVFPRVQESNSNVPTSRESLTNRQSSFNGSDRFVPRATTTTTGNRNVLSPPNPILPSIERPAVHAPFLPFAPYSVSSQQNNWLPNFLPPSQNLNQQFSMNQQRSFNLQSFTSLNDPLAYELFSRNTSRFFGNSLQQSHQPQRSSTMNQPLRPGFSPNALPPFSSLSSPGHLHQFPQTPGNANSSSIPAFNSISNDLLRQLNSHNSNIFNPNAESTPVQSSQFLSQSNNSLPSMANLQQASYQTNTSSSTDSSQLFDRLNNELFQNDPSGDGSSNSIQIHMRLRNAFNQLSSMTQQQQEQSRIEHH